MSKSQQDQYTGTSPGHEFSLVRLVTSNRAFVLLFALFLQILLSGPDIGGRLFDLIIRMITVIAAINMTAVNRRHLITGMILGVPTLILVLVMYLVDNIYLDWITYSFLLSLYLYILRLMLIQIFNAKFITLNTIGLALCTYVLLGSVWVLFYTPVHVLDPNAFTFTNVDDASAFHNLTYFSYVTLTTLGYGDISPVSNLARNLAVIEAQTGTLFLAVLISRLVGSYVSRNKDD